ncbi:MAG: hypothetical protein ABS87_10380 [Sphingomonas sp. SCN 67-18]|nr:MAG: hypothetical protein ABS87_10380 [Sphingomonas sp. SCN 67-18]
MMKMIMLITAFTLTTAFAQPSAAGLGDTDGSKSVKDAEKLVCRSTPTTGSRMPHKVCKTQAQWDGEARAYQNDFERARGANLQSKSGS